MATADIDLDYRERVLSRLWNEPDGMTFNDLIGTFPWWRHPEVCASLRDLIARGLVVEVARTHGTDHSHKDHARLMVLRRQS